MTVDVDGAAKTETAVATHIVDRAIRTWLFQVLSHHDGTLPLGAWRLLELPRLRVADEKAAGEHIADAVLGKTSNAAVQ